MKEFDSEQSHANAISEKFERIIDAFARDGLGSLKSDIASFVDELDGMKDDGPEAYAILGILSSISTRDEKLEPKEIEFIQKLFPDIDVKKAIYHFTINPIDLQSVKAILNKKQMTIIFILAWQIALYDGHLDASEKDYLTWLKREFDLNENEIRDYKMLLFSKILI